MTRSIVAALALIVIVLLAPTGASAQGAPGGGGGAPVLIPSGHSGTSPVPWIIMGCVGGTVLSAMIANWRDNRELTWNEAASCGILFWFAQPVRPRKVRRR